MADGPGGAGSMRATAPFALRSQYLAGGVNTGAGWTAWDGGGAFVTNYVADSTEHGIIPVFDYYMLLQSNPSVGSDEAAMEYSNLNNPGTMRAYYEDLMLFFERAGATGSRVILHFEPDLWGYLQRRSVRDDASTVTAEVASSGIAELAGLPDSAAGLAQAVLRLRDRYAPNVLVAYHLSVWGTGNDILYSKPSGAAIDALAARAGAFFLSLHARFDLTFAEASDRDAAFKQYVYADRGASWWAPADYARNMRFIARFVTASARRVVLWQVPLGNTRMRAMNDSWGHYQDNHVEWFLEDPTREHLAGYANAGVVGLIFGGGASGTTCACDADRDGVTNPAPISGNSLDSLSADDDGGFFRARASSYYAAGALRLPAAAPIRYPAS
jgi:hypothetical protein